MPKFFVNSSNCPFTNLMRSASFSCIGLKRREFIFAPFSSPNTARLFLVIVFAVSLRGERRCAYSIPSMIGSSSFANLSTVAALC